MRNRRPMGSFEQWLLDHPDFSAWVSRMVGAHHDGAQAEELLVELARSTRALGRCHPRWAVARQLARWLEQEGATVYYDYLHQLNYSHGY